MDAQLASSKPTPVQIQNERFTTKQHGYNLKDVSLNFSGNIAVSGVHYERKRTFIDLYFGRNSVSGDKLFYSKEFDINMDYCWRYVSFLEKHGSELLVVTCAYDQIQIIDMKNKSKVLQSLTFSDIGCIRCLTVREGEIFVGFLNGHEVYVLNDELKVTRKITLKAIKDGDSPCDIQVIKDTLFVCTYQGSVLSMALRNGNIITEYTSYTTEEYKNWIGCTMNPYARSRSITVSERLGLVAVLWGSRLTGDRIMVYSLNENKCFLVFDVDSNDVCRIRISDKDRRIITGNTVTGEIKMYDLEQLFSFEAMKTTLACIVSSQECEELIDYFGITYEEMEKSKFGNISRDLTFKEETMIKMECVLTIIEEKGHLHPYNINNLTNAVSSLGDEMHVSILKGPMEGYILHGITMKNLMAEMVTRQKEGKVERNQLSSRLEEAERKIKELQEENEALHHEMDQVKQKYEEQEQPSTKKSRKQKLKEEAGSTKKMKTSTEAPETTKQPLDLRNTESAKQTEMLTKDQQTRTELETEGLKQTKQSLIVKEPKAMKEVLNQQKEATAELQKAFGNESQSQSKDQSRTSEERFQNCFTFLKKNLTDDWKDVGRCLLISDDELSRFCKDNKDDVAESIYKMLLCWQRKNASGATPEKLMEALKEVGRADLAEKLAKIVKE